MQNLGVEAERKFWCPRCGTIKSYIGTFEDVAVPTRNFGRAGLLAACEEILVAVRPVGTIAAMRAEHKMTLALSVAREEAARG